MRKIRLMFCIAITSAVLFVQSTAAQENWIDSFKWREIGPTATGGRVTDIAVFPDNEHHILVASAAGGLWETTNNGTTWNCIFENEGTITIGDVAIDPSNTQNIWIGSGEANNQRSSLWGDGIYKSADGGKTWTNMGLKDSQHIGRVVVHPTDSQTVFVAALGNLYSASPERGLFKTSDGGETWKKVLFVNNDVGVVDVIVDPKNPDNVIAASYERRRRAWDFDGAGPGSAIYRSTDGGESFDKVTDGLPTGEIGRIGLDYYANDPNIVYATVSNQNPAPANQAARPGRGRLPGANAPGAMNSVQQDDSDSPLDDVLPEEPSDDSEIKTNLGFSIDLSTSEPTVKDLARNSAAQRAGLRDGDVIVSAAGIDGSQSRQLGRFFNDAKSSDRIRIVIQRGDNQQTITLTPAPVRAARPRQIGGEVYRSEDGGASWKKVNDRPAGGSPAYYYGQIRVDPQDDQRIYMLSVPVYVSEDGGKTFRQDGARSVHVDHHAFWVNPKNSNHLMLGNDGGFHISYDRGKSWDYVFNLPLAQFYAITVDMQHPYHVYGGLQDNGSWGGPSRSNSGSVTRNQWYRVGGGDGFYVQIDPEDHNVVISESQFGAIGRLNRATGARRSIRPPASDPDTPDRYNWNSPILMSKYDSKVIYFAGNKLFRSKDQGDNWETISPDLTTADPAKISGNVPHCTITTIAESPHSRKTLMVGTDDGKVQVTTDLGANWIDLSRNFPFRPSNWWCSRVEFSHADENTAYATFTGYREDDFRPFVFKTTDLGKTWASIASDLPGGCVNVLKQDPVNPDTLYVGTEFGAFVSLNDGKNWLSLSNGLPRVSVQDLVVHPRDGALVIGTHGRGIFVLDDVTPFQHFDDKVADKNGHLFPIRDYTPLPRTGGGGSIFAGDRKRVAANPSSGASIWYHLKEDVDAEDISVVIYDANDDEVVKLRADNKAGLHRVSFPSGGGGRRGFRGQRGGPAARAPVGGPGMYWAVLTIGEKNYQQKFYIKSPN